MAPANLGAPRAVAAVLVLLCLSLAAAQVTGCSGEPTQPEGDFLEIRGQRVTLEITRTREEQTRGLSHRQSLPWNHGMLFEYDSPGFPLFWMKDMHFDIDIVWIRDSRIVDISPEVPHVPPGDPIPQVRPSQLTDTVLEIPAGYAAAHGWRPGDRVHLVRGRDARR